MFKLIFTIIFMSVSVISVYSQTFTKVSQGEIVTDSENSGGSAWIDVNNDSYPDLFVSNGNQNEQDNKLYINNGDGTFTPVNTGEIVNDGGSSIGSTWGDYDGDGNIDLFVVNRATSQGNSTLNFLYKNNGDGSFNKILSGEIVSELWDSNISSWVDIENDGDLDLFVINFNQKNILYLNNGSGSFTKIDTGAITQQSFSISGIWGDYNNDSFPDLYIGNGGSQANFLFKNNGNGSFIQITSGTPVTDPGASTGCSWVDFNNDGNLDLFVANFLSTNNALYRNDGPPNYSFTKITSGDIVNNGGSSVGSAWGDIDNNGFLDLVVGNSNGSGENNLLYMNNGDETFTRITVGDIVGDGGNTFGISMNDFDLDGDIDVYAANINNQPNFFYVNDGNANNWINILLEGVTSNYNGIGAKVRAKANIFGNDVWQYREVSSQSGYNSQNSLNIEFGLGDVNIIDSLVINWTSGSTDSYTNVAANNFYKAEEDQGLGIVTSADNQSDQNIIPEVFSLEQNYPNPFNPSTTIEFTVAKESNVSITIFNAIGQQVKVLLQERKPVGSFTIQFNASELNSGVYFYRMRAGEFEQTKKMILIK